MRHRDCLGPWLRSRGAGRRTSTRSSGAAAAVPGERGLPSPTATARAFRVEAAQDRVDGAAGEAGGFHDVEAVMAAIQQGLEDERGGVGQSHVVVLSM